MARHGRRRIKPAQLVQPGWHRGASIGRAGSVRSQQNGQWRIGWAVRRCGLKPRTLVIACAGNSFAMVHLALVAAGLVPESTTANTVGRTQGPGFLGTQRAEMQRVFHAFQSTAQAAWAVPHARGARLVRRGHLRATEPRATTGRSRSPCPESGPHEHADARAPRTRCSPIRRWRGPCLARRALCHIRPTASSRCDRRGAATDLPVRSALRDGFARLDLCQPCVAG
ncbi:MAG: hypothetical protein IPI20_18605 [Rhodoferax sp.]|nr:hypothetical protein [Rhodoferax sp.]